MNTCINKKKYNTQKKDMGNKPINSLSLSEIKYVVDNTQKEKEEIKLIFLNQIPPKGTHFLYEQDSNKSIYKTDFTCLGYDLLILQDLYGKTNTIQNQIEKLADNPKVYIQFSPSQLIMFYKLQH